jgi:hypothetical protein
MKKLLTAVIMLSLFSGMAYAQESQDTILKALKQALPARNYKEITLKERPRLDKYMEVGYMLRKSLGAELTVAMDKALREGRERDIDTLKESPEFAKIINLYADIKESSWPADREKIAGQTFVNNSFIFQHFTGTMDKYMELAKLVKNFKNKKDAPALGKSVAVGYLKELAKLIDEPFVVKWSKDLFIISLFIDREENIFWRSQNYRDQVNDFADMLKQYKK